MTASASYPFSGIARARLVLWGTAWLAGAVLLSLDDDDSDVESRRHKLITSISRVYYLM